MPASHPYGVLITRPEPGASETAARVAALGLRPVLAPLLEVRMRPRPLPAPTGVQAVLVASLNALAAVPASHHDVMLLAVGEGTAARARQAGFRQVHSADGDAAALVELAARLCRPEAGPLLLPAGQGASLPLAAALRARGFRVRRLVVYTTRDVPSLPTAAAVALAEGSVGAALFFSAGAARVFVDLQLRAGDASAVVPVMAVAIAPRAAAALAPLPWRVVRVALQPNQEDMLAHLR